MKIISGRAKEAPWSLLLYGNAGIGKSSLAARAPKPLFIDLEHGLDRIDCDRTPVIDTHKAFVEALTFAAKSDYRTIVIDTIDALEKLLIAEVLTKHSKDSLADFGYGKGEVALRNEWTRTLMLFQRLKQLGKNLILTAHEQSVRVEDPTSEAYDSFTINVDKKAAPAIVAAVDAVLFARLETVLKEREGTKKSRAVSTGKRVLHCLGGAAFTSKNRFGLPATVPMTPKIFDLIAGSKAEEETGELLQPAVSPKAAEVRSAPEGDVSSAGV